MSSLLVDHLRHSRVGIRCGLCINQIRKTKACFTFVNGGYGIITEKLLKHKASWFSSAHYAHSTSLHSNTYLQLTKHPQNQSRYTSLIPAASPAKIRSPLHSTAHNSALDSRRNTRTISFQSIDFCCLEPSLVHTVEHARHK